MLLPFRGSGGIQSENFLAQRGVLAVVVALQA
jgi:hypothetical protein